MVCKKRYLRIERTTFKKNLIKNVWVNSHFGCSIEASDLVKGGELHGTKNLREGNYFIRTTKEHDLKDSNIFYVRVPNKLTSDVNQNSFDQDQFLFQVNSEETKLINRIKITKSNPLHEKLYRNFTIDLKCYDEFKK